MIPISYACKRAAAQNVFFVRDSLGRRTEPPNKPYIQGVSGYILARQGKTRLR